MHLIQDQISKHLILSSLYLSFSTGIFPTISKKAKVIPTHKNNSKLKVPNIEPISLLSNIDYIFEKLMHSTYWISLGKTNPLLNFKFQIYSFKFCKNYSESTRLWENCMWDFYRLWKSFDTMSHNILLKKLDHCGIRGFYIWLYFF